MYFSICIAINNKNVFKKKIYPLLSNRILKDPKNWLKNDLFKNKKKVIIFHIKSDRGVAIDI